MLASCQSQKQVKLKQARVGVHSCSVPPQSAGQFRQPPLTQEIPQGAMRRSNYLSWHQMLDCDGDAKSKESLISIPAMMACNTRAAWSTRLASNVKEGYCPGAHSTNKYADITRSEKIPYLSCSLLVGAR